MIAFILLVNCGIYCYFEALLVVLDDCTLDLDVFCTLHLWPFTLHLVKIWVGLKNSHLVILICQKALSISKYYEMCGINEVFHFFISK